MATHPKGAHHHPNTPAASTAAGTGTSQLQRTALHLLLLCWLAAVQGGVPVHLGLVQMSCRMD
jgi:hypothetical protein